MDGLLPPGGRREAAMDSLDFRPALRQTTMGISMWWSIGIIAFRNSILMAALSTTGVAKGALMAGLLIPWVLRQTAMEIFMWLSLLFLIFLLILLLQQFTVLSL